KCPRLTQYIRETSRKKVKRYLNCTYWGKPLPGFGDAKAKLLIIGLAPAAHGGNRTGRLFTGDDSGNWLVKALYENGFANKPTSLDRNDGLRLCSTYITAAVRCAPPGNKPTKTEFENCSEYLKEELTRLKQVEMVVTLGKLSFDSYLANVELPAGRRKPAFKHGVIYDFGKGLPMLASSYHPSRQNTQTGKMTWPMWMGTFRKIRRILDGNGIP
ncbi:MAG: uracil-DNA glycosylase, partial [Candidatus Bathyarchaeia archaeon]